MALLHRTEIEVFTTFHKFKAFVENQAGRNIKSSGLMKVLNVLSLISIDEALLMALVGTKHCHLNELNFMLIDMKKVDVKIKDANKAILLVVLLPVSY